MRGFGEGGAVEESVGGGVEGGEEGCEGVGEEGRWDGGSGV